MNGHPVILEKRIQPICQTGQFFDVIGLCKNRRLHNIPNQQRWITAYPNIVCNVNAKNHGHQKCLNQRKHRQNRRLPTTSLPPYNRTKDHVPEHPQQETPLLPFPKGGKYILKGEIIRNMRKRIVVLVVFVDHDVKHDPDDRKYADSVKRESHPSKHKPPPCIRKSPAIGRQAICRGSHESSDKSANDPYVPYLTGEQMLTHILYATHKLSVRFYPSALLM